MQDIKNAVVTFVGAIFALLAPIQNFMYAMLILFGINFFFGLFSARMRGEKWSTNKALMFFVYVLVFLVIACMAFIIGHLMGEHEQAIAVVKILCYIAVYIFGTNIFRNLRHIVPKESAWYRLFDLCYYVLSVKFIEKFDFVRKWQAEQKEEADEARAGKEGEA